LAQLKDRIFDKYQNCYAEYQSCKSRIFKDSFANFDYENGNFDDDIRPSDSVSKFLVGLVLQV